MADLGGVIAVDGGGGVVEGGQQVLADVAHRGGGLIQALQHILDMGAVQRQKPLPDRLGRMVGPGNADPLSAGAGGIHHQLHQLIQAGPVQAAVLDQDPIVDILQNPVPEGRPLSGPVRPPGGVGGDWLIFPLFFFLWFVFLLFIFI